jgi:putative metallohydrolase (TIGR04338 family)
MRDTQRSKVYNAEMAVRLEMAMVSRNAGVELRSVAQLQRYVDKVLARKRVAAKYPRPVRRGILVKDGRGRRAACGGYGSVSLPLWARTEQVVLHEVAHCLVGGGQNHNWQFAECALFLVREVMGVEAADILKASYRQHNVAFTAPREKRAVSPERRAELAERLAANRRQLTSGSFAIKVPPCPEKGRSAVYWIRRTSGYFGATATYEPDQDKATVWTTREGVERFAAKHCTNRPFEIVDLES